MNYDIKRPELICWDCRQKFHPDVISQEYKRAENVILCQRCIDRRIAKGRPLVDVGSSA